METLIIIILVILLVVMGVLAIFLQHQLAKINKTLGDKIGENAKEMREVTERQIGSSTELIEKVLKQLGNVERETAQVVTITEHIHNLERVLTNTKHRGNYGETTLELELGNMLAETQFTKQYQFSNGDKVDAVIHTPEKLLIPIDAKFPLENYKRYKEEKDTGRRAEHEKEFAEDLKKRINETAKYIRPKEGTLDFALMFIPSEAMYYDLLVNTVGGTEVNKRSLIDYAYRDKNVVIVSPTTFLAYLHVIRYGFNAFQIEESSKEIRKRVFDLKKHINTYDDYLRRMGGTLSTTVNHYNTAYKALGMIDKDVAKISDGTSDIEPAEVDRPVLDGDNQ
jgi:DNA recombination protein RmuC